MNTLQVLGIIFLACITLSVLLVFLAGRSRKIKEDNDKAYFPDPAYTEDDETVIF